MQTFLPYSDFKKSAECLDYRRLGKQRVEAWQIYLALTEPDYGWKQHPIVKMWKGFKGSLLLYGYHICSEWISRGYKDTMKDRFLYALNQFQLFESVKNPAWLGREDFHSSHRSNLLRKDKEYYSQFNWKEDDSLPYVWVVE